jgi:allophanate hydrolase
MMPAEDTSLDITTLSDGYRRGAFTPADVIAQVLSRIRTEAQHSHHIWIHCLGQEEIRPYLDALAAVDPADRPLYGIPFAIKDNIDLAGVPTTAACEAYAYVPHESAHAVALLIEAGAIPVGKTNLDQFATGLVGTRSPYGAGQCSFDRDYISGGSSSGSALAVALGLVSFALGTDTAGSGRVPAAFNNIIGHKPTRGLVSTRGVVPACRTLDCVSIFSLSAGDAARVLEVCGEYDAADDYARRAPASPGCFDSGNFRFGVPRADQLDYFGNDQGAERFAAAVTQLESLGGQPVEIDFGPFLEAARLLYEGPWISERYTAIRDFIRQKANEMWPVTRQIITAGENTGAVAAFEAQYRLQHLKRRSEAVWDHVDVVVTPTAGRQYTIDEVAAEPVKLNSNLGYYTNFMNLLDLSACAVPAGFQRNGLAFGVTLFAPAHHDHALLALADRLHRRMVTTQGALQLPLPVDGDGWPLPDGWTRVVVCGAHLSGLPLNHQLTDRGGLLVEKTRTAPCYRLYALPGGPPYRPGLIRSNEGDAIAVEVWALPLEYYGSFVAGIPSPLGIGMVELESGEVLQGFLCEPYALQHATDITSSGGWRAHIKGLA